MEWDSFSEIFKSVASYQVDQINVKAEGLEIDEASNMPKRGGETRIGLKAQYSLAISVSEKFGDRCNGDCRLSNFSKVEWKGKEKAIFTGVWVSQKSDRS